MEIRGIAITRREQILCSSVRSFSLQPHVTNIHASESSVDILSLSYYQYVLNITFTEYTRRIHLVILTENSVLQQIFNCPDREVPLYFP